MSSISTRVFNKIRRDGLRSSLDSAYCRVRQRVSFDETHFWFERSLTNDDTGKIPMSLGSKLVAGTLNDMDLIEQLPGISVEESVFRLEGGDHLWMAVLKDKPAFSCWTLYGSAPVIAAPGGRMALPPNVVMLEDSIALPGLRNQGLARCTIHNVIHILSEMGFSVMITRTRDNNAPAQKLVQKVGFRKTTLNRYRRSGLSSYGFVSGDDTPLTYWIAGQMEL